MLGPNATKTRPQNQSKKSTAFGRPPDRFWVDFGLQLGSILGKPTFKFSNIFSSWGLLGAKMGPRRPKKPQEAPKTASKTDLRTIWEDFWLIFWWFFGRFGGSFRLSLLVVVEIPNVWIPRILGCSVFSRDHYFFEFPELRGTCLLYTSPSPRDRTRSRMPSSA